MPLNWRKHDVATDTPEKALQGVFGHRSFRNHQEQVIAAIRRNEPRVLYVAPAGSGKSVSYQIPAILQPEGTLTVVISPLIALMRQQIEDLAAKGIPAELLCCESDKEAVLAKVRSRLCALLYCSPEQLTSVPNIEAMKAGNIGHTVVDEAHCIGKWGSDFRPAYSVIGSNCRQAGITQISAFSATISPRVKRDVLEVLGGQEWKEFVDDPYRNNVEYHVTHATGEQEKNAAIVELIRCYAPGENDAVIIYCSSRRDTDRVHAFLSGCRIYSYAYHAEYAPETRMKVEGDFRANKKRILVTTNALGMGMDKGNIRLIIHNNMPGSIEDYLQETGRAGRDGNPARCELLFDQADQGIQEYFINIEAPKPFFIMGVYRTLCEMRGKAESRPDGFFNPNWFALYKKFQKRNLADLPIDRNSEVNAAISVLLSCGLARREGNVLSLEEFAEGDEKYGRLVAVAEQRRKILQAILGQMLRYANDPHASQQKLISLLQENIVS